MNCGFLEQTQRLPCEEEKEERQCGEAREELQQPTHSSRLTGSFVFPSSLVGFILFFKIFFNSKNKVVYYGADL